jgi:hypothetical protein
MSLSNTRKISAEQINVNKHLEYNSRVTSGLGFIIKNFFNPFNAFILITEDSVYPENFSEKQYQYKK